MAEQVEVPKDIVWDHRVAPADLHWRLQRLADFFPRYGRDRTTVGLLFGHRQELKLDPATRPHRGVRARSRGTGAGSLSATLESNAILAAGQKEFLRAFVRSPLAARYYLSGGTALAAFHLGHRLSEDLDLSRRKRRPSKP